jgi:hypothetical protein
MTNSSTENAIIIFILKELQLTDLPQKYVTIVH